MVRLQKCELRFCSLRTDQLNGLVTYIRSAENLQLKHLGLSENNLSEVSSGLLADAVVRLEECDLDDCNLTTNQLNGLFTSIRKAKNLQLKDLGLGWNILSEIPSDILAGAVARLETVGFGYTYLTKDQLCRIFTLIAQRKCGKLKEISLDEISGVSRDLIHSAEENTDVKIVYDYYHDEDGEVEESDSDSEDRCQQQETADSTEPFNKKLRSWRKWEESKQKDEGDNLKELPTSSISHSSMMETTNSPLPLIPSPVRVALNTMPFVPTKF